MRRRAGFTACAALTITAIGLIGTSAAATQSAATARWRVVFQTPGNRIGEFDSVIAPAPTSAWAFGWTWTGGIGAPSYPIARHWNGHRWSSVAMPSSLTGSGIACASASSPANVWAFAGAGGARAGDPPAVAAALRLHGSRWATEKVLSLSGFDKYVTGCNVLSPTNAWVFGAVYAGLGAGVGTWHLTRSGWHHLNTGHLFLFSASAASAKDIWAIGADLTLSGQSFLERWNGNSWQRVRSVYSVLPRKAGIGAVNAQSANSVWVQALTGAQRAPTTVVVHWNGKGWHQVPRGSVGYYLPTAVPDGNGGWWAVPYSAKDLTRYLLHEANGRWTRFPLPTPQPLYIHSLRLAHIPRSRAMLATGIYLRSRHSAGVLLAFGALP
ncbi:MAG TPA: hypothetical protein VEV63_07205 [Streptosporangiaceae bacterium]|nr:hypothetical protein [Streptosporangiaceae bacterium]